jgi:hypothetical protein
MDRDHQTQFILISKHRMVSHYLLKFEVCLEEVSDSFLWEIDEEGTNSIGGIILHIVEHIKRNRQRYDRPEIIFKSGIELFFPSDGLKRGELKILVRKTFEDWSEALINANKETIEMYSLYDLIEHTGYHLGQVVDRFKG